MSEISQFEEKYLQKFKANLEDLDLEYEVLLKDMQLIRWLRAREMDISKAEKMLRDHLLWREEDDVDDILQSTKFLNNLIKTYQSHSKIIGYDKQGNVLIFIHFGRIDFKAILRDYGRKMSDKGAVYFLEKVFQIALVNSTENIMKGMTVIIDMSELSYWQFASVEVVDFLLNGVKQFQLHYPEFLAKAFVINASFVFNGFWALVKPLLHPSTQEKIEFLGSDKRTIEESMSKYTEWEQVPSKCRDAIQIESAIVGI